jgi:hypothetical protein
VSGIVNVVHRDDTTVLCGQQKRESGHPREAPPSSFDEGERLTHTYRAGEEVMNPSNNQANKKVYAAPKLVVYGSIRELTKAASGSQPKPTHGPTIVKSGD